MAPQNQSSRLIIISAILLVFLLIIAVAVTIFTRNVTKKIEQKTSTATTSAIPTPTEAVRSIYLDLPQTFPKDFPLPKLAKVTVASEDDQTWNVVLSTTTPLDDIVAFYLKELPNTDWEIVSQQQAAGLTILDLARENKEAIITIGKGEQGVTISITILKNAS